MAGKMAQSAIGGNEKEIRRIIIVAHGETVEKIFGHLWLKYYDDDDGNLKCSRAFSTANYVTFEDGNLPVSRHFYSDFVHWVISFDFRSAYWIEPTA
jgi:hypothetical protein